MKTEKIGEGVELPELEAFTELFERSKNDRALIVGSEVREVVGAYRKALTEKEELKREVEKHKRHADMAIGCLEVKDQLNEALRPELASLRTSVVSGEWIDCRDRLPPMNPHNRCTDWDFSDRVEVVSESVVCIADMATDIRNGKTNWISESGERLAGVTYWKNLPAIPKPIEREG